MRLSLLDVFIIKQLHEIGREKSLEIACGHAAGDNAHHFRVNRLSEHCEVYLPRYDENCAGRNSGRIRYRCGLPHSKLPRYLAPKADGSLQHGCATLNDHAATAGNI